MKNGTKIAIVVLLALAVAATFALRSGKRAEYVAVPAPAPAPAAVATGGTVAAKTTADPVQKSVPAAAKPRLLELGSMRCQACLEMAKVLDALRANQGTRLQVDFIDVFEQPDAADRHKISLIPTQILFDGAGKEIFRHTGYFSHDDILAKFSDLGVPL